MQPLLFFTCNCCAVHGAYAHTHLSLSACPTLDHVIHEVPVICRAPATWLQCADNSLTYSFETHFSVRFHPPGCDRAAPTEVSSSLSRTCRQISLSVHNDQYAGQLTPMWELLRHQDNAPKQTRISAVSRAVTGEIETSRCLTSSPPETAASATTGDGLCHKPPPLSEKSLSSTASPVRLKFSASRTSAPS